MRRNVPAWVIVLVAALLVFALVSAANNARTERDVDATITQIDQAYR